MPVSYFLQYLRDFYPVWDDALANELLREFNLPLDRPLDKLSRGMRIKAALVSILAYRPRVVVLDEPFSGLDALVRDEVVQGLLTRSGDATVLISSHDLAEIETFASHIGYMEAGGLKFAEKLQALPIAFAEASS
jgi:ABC-2 type transport system ATP-binding protein